MEVLSDLAKALMLIAGFVSSYLALRQYWRDDRRKFIKSLWMFLGYAFYCGIGVAVMLWIVPSPLVAGEDGGVKAAALIGFILSWIFLGALWLARVAPRYQELPRWVDNRFGLVDLALMAIIVVGFVVLLR